MSKPDFVYVIYIQASQEQVWEGLTSPELTRQYWMHDNISDWKVGSRWENKSSGDSGAVAVAGEVVESEHPSRLVLTWCPPNDEGNAEKTSRVAFEIHEQEGWPNGPWVQLRIEHTNLEPDSDMYHSISFGWPALMSGLKTLLERGSV